MDTVGLGLSSKVGLAAEGLAYSVDGHTVPVYVVLSIVRTCPNSVRIGHLPAVAIFLRGCGGWRVRVHAPTS